MAPAAAAAEALSAVVTTASTIVNRTTKGTIGYTTTVSPTTANGTTTLFPDYDGNSGNYPYFAPAPDYVYYYSGYYFYVVLIVLFVFLMPFAIIMSSIQRKRQEAARRLVLQRQRARREMEISVANNSTNMGGNSNDCIEADNDLTILPKGMDLPPSYDELNVTNNFKQEGNLGASTVTITTDLACSNPNLAAALDEPPPDYQGPIEIVETPATTTISTTTVVSVTPRI